MSVEAPKPIEETPAVEPTKAVPEQEPDTATAASTVDPATATTEPAPAAESTPVVADGETATPAAVDPEEVKKDETVVEAVPTSEGVLGYKEPHFFK